MREELTKVEAPLSPTATICALITMNGSLSLSISKDKTIKNRKPIFTEKSQIVADREQNLLIYSV